MFKTFFFLELKTALKRPMIYIFFLIMGLMVFGAVSSDSIMIGGAIGNVYRNSPHVITSYVGIMTFFGLLMATAFFNNAALRDYKNSFNEILFSTPLSKAGYYFGRFFGALLLATTPLLGIFFGVLIASVIAPMAGWIDADRFGPFYLETFVNNYFLFILPNIFFAGAIIFALANKFKNPVVSFVGALVIVMTYIISGSFMSDIDNETIASLLDIFGMRTYSLSSKYYTTIEKNTLSPSFSGLLLLNRITWIGLGLVILITSYLGFSFKEKNKKVKATKEESSETETSFELPKLNPLYSKQADWLQFKSFFAINFKSITKSITFKILFLFSAIILIASLFGGFEYFGLKSYPLTYKMIDRINNSTTIFVIIILVFFSGELIWRDRDNKINEVIDSTPHVSFISLAAKALSLVGVTVALHLFFILVGIIYQLISGYTRIELDVYFLDFFYGHLPTYIVWSGVMILIQVLINNKYLAYFASILVVFIWSIMLSIFDVNTNMLSIASSPSIRYSDISTYGPGLKSTLWFNVYWVLFAVIALLIAGALWNRGVLTSLKKRVLSAKQQLPRKYKIITVVVVGIWVAVASFIYYNTQVLNAYDSADTLELLRADFEKKYKKYENTPQPKTIAVKYNVAIFPYKRNVDVNAKIKLKNETSTKIDSLHFVIDKDWNTEFTIPNSKLVLDDQKYNYLIYKLDHPLEAGETLDIEIDNKYITKGFKNGRGNTSIVRNGTFLNNRSILPSFGYMSGAELSDKNTRKKYDLAPKERMLKLDSTNLVGRMKNYLSDGRSDFIDVETIISTSADQTAIAPGSLQKKWEENGRNYYHYKVDKPSLDFYAFISGKFKVATRKWKHVDIEVYHDEKHDKNIEMMLDAVERSLEKYSRIYGPYYHNQCRIVEFPRYSTFAQAFPGTMPYSESFGFVTNLEDEEDNNVIDAVIAHEMAHQWWAHQLIGASMQGSTMMSESFAEYSSLVTMKSITENPMKMRKFLKYDHDKYLRGRGGEIEKEMPLYQVENQQYIHYGKGSVVLYALQDYIGEEKVNKAMRNFLEEFKYKAPPYPTSLDFMKHIEPEVPDSLNYLINDWFKDIVLYDNRLRQATYKKQENGKYLVSLEIESHKIKADSIGNETSMQLNDWIDIGAFADNDEEELIFEKRVKFNNEKMNFTFELDTIPARAGVDPRHLLIDRVYKDNIKAVKEEE